jgi:hypothetical protein
LDSEVKEFIKVFKISKDDLVKSHEIDGTSEKKETIKKERIDALNRIEILGYSSEIMDSLKSMKSVKDIKKLRLKFQDLVSKNEKLARILKENDDLERSEILDEFKEIEIRKVSDNSPVFNFKRLLKYFLENKLGDQSKKLSWKVAKNKK